MIGLYGLCLGGFLTSLIASLDNGLSRNPLGSDSSTIPVGQDWLDARMGNF